MPITTTPSTIGALWHALQRPPRPRGPLWPEARLRPLIRSGWVSLPEIEGLLTHADLGLSGFGVCGLPDLFDVPRSGTFAQPGRRPRALEGVERVSTVDLAGLLMTLERLGFAVDPGPLCEALAPGLAARQYVTQAELDVLWHAQDRARRASITLAAAPAALWGEPVAVHRTSAGYRVALHRNAAGAAVALKATAPHWRPKLADHALAA